MNLAFRSGSRHQLVLAGIACMLCGQVLLSVGCNTITGPREDTQQVSVLLDDGPSEKHAGSPAQLMESTALLVEHGNVMVAMNFLDRESLTSPGNWDSRAAQAVAEVMVASERFRQAAARQWGEDAAQALIEANSPVLLSAVNLRTAAKADWVIEGDHATADLQPRLQLIASAQAHEGVWTVKLPAAEDDVIIAMRRTATLVNELAMEVDREEHATPVELQNALVARAENLSPVRRGTEPSVMPGH